MPEFSAHKTTSAAPHILVDARFAAHQRGGDRCRYELAAHLCRQNGARYTFLTYPHGEGLIARHNPDAALLTTRYTPEQHPWSDLYEHVHLPRLARRLRADIYHGTFNVLPLLPPPCANIVTVADMAVFAFPQAYGSRFAAYMRVLIRAGIRQADRVIAISEATKKEITRFLPDAEPKIETILCGVGQEFADAANLDPQTVQETCCRLNIPRPYVLFVGNLEPKKNLARLIAAFQRLRAATDLPQTLVIVGMKLPSGPDSGIDPEAIRDRVHFTGYVADSDLPTLYRGADLVAYPSLYEGFGMPVLEGMAAGVPVLTSSVSSLPEVAAGAAMLADPLDIESMASGLHRALTDQAWREKAVQAGLERAAALSWEANARKTSELYQRVWERGLRAVPADAVR